MQGKFRAGFFFFFVHDCQRMYKHTDLHGRGLSNTNSKSGYSVCCDCTPDPDTNGHTDINTKSDADTKPAANHTPCYYQRDSTSYPTPGRGEHLPDSVCISNQRYVLVVGGNQEKWRMASACTNRAIFTWWGVCGFIPGRFTYLG